MSKAFSKSMRSNNPWIFFFSFVNCNESLTSLVFSPINLPSMKLVWYVPINLSNTSLILFAMKPNAIIVYTIIIRLWVASFEVVFAFIFLGNHYAYMPM